MDLVLPFSNDFCIGDAQFERVFTEEVVDVVGTVFGLREHLLKLALGTVVAMLKRDVNALTHK